MADELEQRVRNLEAERIRPVPPPPPVAGGIALVGLQRLLDLQLDDNDTEETNP